MRKGRKFQEGSELTDDIILFVLTNCNLHFLIDHEFRCDDLAGEKAWWNKYKQKIMEFWNSDIDDKDLFNQPGYYDSSRIAAERKKSKPRLFKKYGMK